MARNWQGQYVVCLASGPSLTTEQLIAVWEWQQMSPRHKVIAVNRTREVAPWADALFAMDAKWWKQYGRDAQKNFAGDLVAGTRHAAVYGAKHFPGRYGHSGAGAIAYVDACHAAKVLLLGYDGAPSAAGRAHWHEDYAAPLTNAASMPKWPAQLAAVGRAVKAQVVNMTPGSHVACFPFDAWERLNDKEYSYAKE